MRWRASCSATNIFRECGEPASVGSWLILFRVEMGFKFVSGIGTFGILVSGIGMPRRLVLAIGAFRIPELVDLAIFASKLPRVVCSTSLSGGNQVDGLPPASHTGAVCLSRSYPQRFFATFTV